MDMRVNESQMIQKLEPQKEVAEKHDDKFKFTKFEHPLKV